MMELLQAAWPVVISVAACDKFVGDIASGDKLGTVVVGTAASAVVASGTGTDAACW